MTSSAPTKDSTPIADTEAGERKPLLEKPDQAAPTEETKLLPPTEEKPKQTTLRVGYDHVVNGIGSVGTTLTSHFKLPEPENVMDYETHDLATWQTYRYFTGTALQNRLLWQVLLKLICLAVVIATLLVVLGVVPEHVKILHLDVVANTLNVFVGLMLAFFLNSSVGRWIATVNGFLGLFDAIRNLSMQMHALGVDPELRRQVTRYGLLSCEFLVVELHARNKTEDEKAANLEELWAAAKDMGLEEWEEITIKDVFKEANRISSQMWIWVASLLGRMAQDGWIPPMASPTYGRIMNLAQDAQEGIRQVRVSMTVQMPFIYTHTLALLVHSNNIISAIYFGTTLSARVCGILAIHGFHFSHIDQFAKTTDGATEIGNAAAMCKSFITHMIAPLMYQAFLQIGLTLAQPFDDKFGPGISAIPTTKLIGQLTRDIQMSETMIDGIEGWDQPSFKAPAKK